MIAHFISFLYIQDYQPSTIASYVSALSYVHKMKLYDDPTDSFYIKKILKGTQNLKKSVDSRLPITKDILTKLFQAVPSVVSNPYNQQLLKAMMSLAYYCFLRIGEMAVKNGGQKDKVIQVTDVKFDNEGNDSLITMSVHITNYKHSDLKPKTISILGNLENKLCPVNAMSNYLAISQHKLGPLFQFPCGTPVSYFYFNSSLKSLLSFIGLDPAVYKGHSFRIGAARGVPQSVIQSMGRWKTDAVKNYIRLHNF